MSIKIERIWGAVVDQATIRRKDQAEKDSSQGQRQQKNPNQENENESTNRQATKEDVEKAIADLRANAQFHDSGITAELTMTPKGIQVSLRQASGAQIRTMSADEFLKLRDVAGGPKEASRGKLLDQKF